MRYEELTGIIFLMLWGVSMVPPHEIYRPQVEPQREFFIGHRHALPSYEHSDCCR